MRTDLTRWFKKGSWALLDRGLMAGSNFVLYVLLARWMPPEEYGAFATAQAVYALLSMVYMAFFTDPMLVFGSGRYEGRFSVYLGTLLYGHGLFSLLGSLLLVGIGLILKLLGQPFLGVAVLVLAVAVPFIQLLALLRQACFARNQPRLAALNGLVYTVALLGGCYVLERFGWLSYTTAIGIMGAASLVSALFLLGYLPLSLPGPSKKGWIGKILLDHWNYGRWLVGASVMQWIPGNIYYFALPIWLGLEANAVFRALTNLLSPFGRIISALNVLLVPALVRVQKEGRPAFDRMLRRALLLFSGVGALYWAALSLLDQPLVAWLYGAPYEPYAYLLITLGLANVMGGVSAVFGSAVQALERPIWWFWSALVTTAFMLTAGIGLILLYGLTGAVISFVLTTVVTAGALAWFLYVRRTAAETADVMGAAAGLLGKPAPESK